MQIGSILVASFTLTLGCCIDGCIFGGSTAAIMSGFRIRLFAACVGFAHTAFFAAGLFGGKFISEYFGKSGVIVPVAGGLVLFAFFLQKAIWGDDEAHGFGDRGFGVAAHVIPAFTLSWDAAFTGVAAVPFISTMENPERLLVAVLSGILVGTFTFLVATALRRAVAKLFEGRNNERMRGRIGAVVVLLVIGMIVLKS